MENQNENEKKDYNKEIIELLQHRMKIGIERYGHGLRIHDDTRQWGTKENSWEEMALEEVLDGLVYTASAILRLSERRKKEQKWQRWRKKPLSGQPHIIKYRQ